MHGPSDGSRSARQTDSPRRLKAWPRPIVVVVLPSPAGVGVIAETRISRAGRLSRAGDDPAPTSFDLRLVASVEDQIVGREAELGGDLVDRARDREG